MSQEQAQNQSQSLNLTLNLDNSGDPQLEQHVFNELHSAGRQLSRMSGVLEVVLTALEGNLALQRDEAVRAVAAFREVQRDIAEAKRERSYENVIIRELGRLAATDRTEHDRVVLALRGYLDAPR